MTGARAHLRIFGKSSTSNPLIRQSQVLVCLLVLLLICANSGFAGNGKQEEAATYRDGIVLVAFRDGTPAAERIAILSRIGAREVKHIGVGVTVVSVERGQVPAAVRSLKEIPSV